MKLLVRLVLAIALLAGAAAALGAFVPASRPALRAGLDRAGLSAQAARWLPAGGPAEASAPATPLPPAVSVVRAATREFRDRLYVSGTLVAREEAMVGPQLDGLRITELLADDGDRVAEGQVLARLDRSQLDALTAESDAALARADASVAQAQNAIAQFEATNAQAQADYSRATRLEAGVMSQSALDSRASASRSSTAQLAGARSALAVAMADKRAQQAQRRELDVRIARTEVRAPVAGVVTRRSARLGALSASGGDALFRVTRDGAVDLDAEVPEDGLARVRLGMAATVTVSGDPNPIPGRVRLVSSEIDRASRLGHVRVALGSSACGLPRDAASLPRGTEQGSVGSPTQPCSGADAVARIGAFATAVVEIGRRDGVAVPASALSGQDGGWAVETVAARDRVESRPVVRGLADGDDVEIRQGVVPGDLVVARASAFLRSGDLVRPMPLGAAAPDREASR